jgi:uncharacterized sulfatase
MNLLAKSIGIGAAAINLSGFVVHAQEKPNILWIIADDLGPDLGCYGNKSAKTPAIDKLASEGILFTQLHSVTAVCSPSRSSLITGMYPVSINCHQHRTFKKQPLPEGILPITEYFRQSGYYVCNGNATKAGQPGKTDYNFDYGNKTIFDGADWTGRKTGQPFFAQMQIHFPHRPFERDTIHPVDRKSPEIPPVYPDRPVTREDWRLYLESVQHVDEYLGKLMERLEKEGLLKNTIVLFFGDQGRPMVRAKQFLYDEGTHTPFIVRFPDKKMAGKQFTDLISNVDIPSTSLVLAGIPLPEKIQGRDIFSGKKREFVFCTRDRMDETVDRIRSVRSNKFKYIRNYYQERPYTQFNTYKTTMYPVLALMKVLYKKGELTPEQAVFMKSNRPTEELYNLENDPFEMKNLAASPDFSSELTRLRLVLDKWLAEYDNGVYPEDAEEVDYWAKDAAKAYQETMKKNKLPVDISDEDFLKWWEKRLGLGENSNL